MENTITKEGPQMTMTVREIFLYLTNATLCIPEAHRHTVVQAMAYKLEEWANVTRPELRAVLAGFGDTLDEMCIHCNEPLPDWNADEQGEPCCSSCQANADANLLIG
jgi:hypothetical protein